MASGAKQTQIATRVDDETLRRLDERCEAERRTRSNALLVALEQLLAQPPESDADRIPATTGEAA